MPGRSLWARIDKAFLMIAAVVGGQAVFAPDELTDTLAFALSLLGRMAPFIMFAVVAVAWLKAARAEWMLARAFEGREAGMIVVAAFVGGLAPFCSCEVIPLVAAALAVGAPLGAVMAFWLASPLMDPAMYLITPGTLGNGFAVAKSAAAVAIGHLGGFATAALLGRPSSQIHFNVLLHRSSKPAAAPLCQQRLILKPSPGVSGPSRRAAQRSEPPSPRTAPSFLGGFCSPT